MPFSALLDANVLVPNLLRDTLLRIAEADLYRPLWSAEILAETRRTIVRLRPNIDHGRLDAMFTSMNKAFTDALVTGYESLTVEMKNDSGDRHVLAAAVAGRADVVVTNNVRHFPREVMDPLNIETLTPDRFLCLQYDLAPVLVVDVIKRQSAETGRAEGNPKISLDDLLDRLSACGAPRFADHLQSLLAAAKVRPRSPTTSTPRFVQP
ncbi:PIN domain-containing protein [Solwaraspora sp. WMMD792]|uniref:PIN domain-containing protein n=1 Tax=Solwaraspora sp. WMMD792 TaxID=3016099 RepID=UPI002417CB9D|nr:PIN domain-containing protein [Solwaraspora sp. WMMD792]MDG4773694.1 PIN domain-containing protein [Solwaraspora sp. WMMD792]